MSARQVNLRSVRPGRFGGEPSKSNDVWQPPSPHAATVRKQLVCPDCGAPNAYGYCRDCRRWELTQGYESPK